MNLGCIAVLHGLDEFLTLLDGMKALNSGLIYQAGLMVISQKLHGSISVQKEC